MSGIQSKSNDAEIQSAETMTESDSHHEDVACTMCGCVCDDLRVHVRGGNIVSTEGACSLAQPFFSSQKSQNSWPSYFRGASVDFSKALDEAAVLLRASKAPLIYGLSRSSSAGQRQAVRLADALGATIDTTASTCHAPSIIALQQVGESTCSLGEARHHCDLCIFWGSNPVRSHPRHAERYSVEPTGQFLARGRADRHVAIVDVRETESSEIADETVVIPPGSDFDVLWTLRCLVAEQPVSQWPSGIEPDTLVQLAQRMRNCKSGIIYFGLGLTRHGVPHANVEALLRLVTDLNAHTRFYARRMRIPGDVAGADSVLCWQTGFPFSVNIARRFPRYSPGEYSANAVLERQEVDSCVLVGSEGVSKLSSEAQTYLKKIPTIVLDYPGIETTWTPTLRFTTPVYGIHLPGTAYRMDEVPIPLRNVLPCDPGYSDAAVLQNLTERCAPQ